MNDKYDAIKLENQICFPLYACAKEIVRRYKPFLEELDLTYTHDDGVVGSKGNECQGLRK